MYNVYGGRQIIYFVQLSIEHTHSFSVQLSALTYIPVAPFTNMV